MHCVLQTVLFAVQTNFYVHIHCNFICGLSDVIIKTFNLYYDIQSVSHHAHSTSLLDCCRSHHR